MTNEKQEYEAMYTLETTRDRPRRKQFSVKRCWVLLLCVTSLLYFTPSVAQKKDVKPAKDTWLRCETTFDVTGSPKRDKDKEILFLVFDGRRLQYYKEVDKILKNYFAAAEKYNVSSNEITWESEDADFKSYGTLDRRTLKLVAFRNLKVTGSTQIWEGQCNLSDSKPIAEAKI
jgi:hypothetical protein